MKECWAPANCQLKGHNPRLPLRTLVPAVSPVQVKTSPVARWSYSWSLHWMSHQWVISSNKNKNNSCCDDDDDVIIIIIITITITITVVVAQELCHVIFYVCQLLPLTASPTQPLEWSHPTLLPDLPSRIWRTRTMRRKAKWFGQMVWHLVHSWPSFLSPGKSENEAYQFRQRERKQLPTQEKLNSSTGLVSPSFLDLWSQKKIKG